MKKIYIILLLMTISSPVFSKIAVLPYKVQSAKNNIIKYENVLCTAIKLTKEINVLFPNKTITGLNEIGISQGKPISKEDLKIFGLKYDLDYILTGTISSSGESFTSTNILYSVNSDQILSKNTFKNSTILKLATIEIKKTLSNIKNIEESSPSSVADIAFIIDTSYHMRSQWDSVKKSIEETASKFIEKFGINTRIYIIPYSENKTYEDASIYENSITKLKKDLYRLNPKGRQNSKSFNSALNYSLTSIKWRQNSKKNIIIINNSSMDEFTFPEKYGFTAKRKQIKIFTINGSQNLKGIENISRLSELTNGINFDITYYEKIYDFTGKPYNIYLERGRLFYSLSKYISWSEGIGRKNNHSNLVEEIEEVYTTKKDLSPDNMAEVFTKERNISLIQKDQTEDNIPKIFLKIFSNTHKKNKSFVGKALISDGAVSIWIRSEDKATMNLLEKYKKKGIYFKTGFQILQSDEDAYGVKLIPININIESQYLTKYCNARLTDIIKNKTFYIQNGIGTPPVWFLDIKVTNTEWFNNKKDIRDVE